MKPSHEPLISVVVIADDADLAEISVRSVFAQDLDGLELVLVDAGSADGAAVRSLAEGDSRIRLIEADFSILAQAKNEGLKQARGKYIAFLNAGAAFEDGALRARLRAFEADPQCRLVHGPMRLMDSHGRDLGATMGRRKTMRFDAAMHPVPLECVMGDAELLKRISFREDVLHHADWLFFAEALRRGAASGFVEQGGAMIRLARAPDLKEESARFDSAMHDVLDWIYAESQDEAVAPQYRQGLARPVRTVARRVCEFPLFVWCLVSRNQDACLRMLASAGFRAYLNSFSINSMAEEVQVQCARQYLIGAQDRVSALDGAVKKQIVNDAEQLGLVEQAPSLYFALCLGLGVAGRFGGAWDPVIADPPLAEPQDPVQAATNLAVVTTFRAGGDADAMRDCAAVLLENCANPWIRVIHVLLEGDVRHFEEPLDATWVAAIRRNIECGKLLFESIPARPNYKQLFDYTNTLGRRTVAVVNADIVIPPEAARQIVQSRAEQKEPVYVLSRWNRTPAGAYLQGMQPSPPWPQWTARERGYLERDFWSYDSYVFDTPFDAPSSLETIRIGTAGCDLAIAASLRLAGMSIENPCLTIKTLHHDNKPQRDYRANGRGLEDERHCMENFHADLIRRFPASGSFRQSLERIEVLSMDTAWLGGPGHADIRQTIFLMASHVLWQRLGDGCRISHVEIRIENGDLDSAKKTILHYAQDVIDRRVFISWELSGFPRSGHIGDMLVADEDLEAVGYVLFGYPWQTMLHLDRATEEARTALTEMREGIGRILNIENMDSVRPAV